MRLKSTLATLQALERELHEPKARRDRERLAALLHPTFHEFGRSGASYTRADLLARLPAESPAAAVHAQDFAAQELAPAVVLLTYRSAHITLSGALERHTNRTSIWRRESAGWQLLFHQGTPTEAFAAKLS